MKKAIILAAAMMMILASCGSSDETVTESGKVELSDGSATATASGTEVTTAEETAAATATTAPQPAAYSDDDAAVIYKGVTLAIDADMAAALETLGQPDSKQENPNCLSGTKGTTYMYGSTMINVYESDGKEYIESVLADGDKNASTPKGAAVGGSASDIAAAYGEGNASDFMVEYKGSRTSMMFYTEGGSITGIFITKV